MLSPRTAFGSPPSGLDGQRPDAVSESLALNASLADRPAVAAAVVVAWSLSGLVVGALLSRRGHAARPIGALGLVFGPLLLGFARANLRSREETACPVVLRPSRPLGGEQRVLLAVRDEPRHAADALPLLRARSAELGEVWIGYPVSFEDGEAAQEGRVDEEDPAARDVLEQAAVFLEEFAPGLLLLPGRFEDAVERQVRSGAVDMAVLAGDDAVQSALCRGSELRTITMVLGPSE